MPFIQRIISPVYVSRGKVDESVTNELECVTNNTLANIIRQLSSLSQHAEDMFADLYRETNKFFNRATDLNNRVEHLTIKVTQLNPTEEEGKLVLTFIFVSGIGTGNSTASSPMLEKNMIVSTVNA